MAVIKMVQVNWLRGLFLLVSVLFIAACGGGDSTESTATTAAPTSAASGSGSVPTATIASGSGNASSAATSAPQATATQTSSGGSADSLDLEEALDQITALYEELLGVLNKVTDEASARDAADAMTRIGSKFEELDERLKDFSEEDITKAFLSGRLAGFSQDFTNEMIRISSDPAIFGFLSEAFENFNPN